VTIPVIWLTILLSLLLHVAALVIVWPHLHQVLTFDPAKPGPTASALAVQLAAERDRTAGAPPSATAAASPPPASVPPSAPRRAAPVAPRPRPRVPETPPVLTRPEPQAPRPVEPAPPALPTPPRPPPQPEPERARPTPQPLESDLASYVEARRRARGEASSPAPSSGSAPAAAPGETDAQRLNRIVAANLGLDRKQAFGYDPSSAGGLFQIRRVGYDDAEFYFLGLDRDINRNAKQLVEVRRGDAPDIRVAVVRKMIAIIRDNVSGDFLWTSQRLGRQVRMSARPEDNAALEDFILHDVFPDERR